MDMWPVPYESQLIDTRYGITHVIESGTSGPPLVLLHAATGFGATQWYPNVQGLSEAHRVFAVDYIGSAGKGTQTRAMFSREDCRDWLTEMFDGLALTRPDVVGSSQGGWMTLNLALLAPERVNSIALLAPAASILPFRPWVRLGIRLGPVMPASTGRGAIESMVGGRIEVDERIVRLLTLHLSHFRYQRLRRSPRRFPPTSYADCRSRCCYWSENTS
jgi:pimeloyl-ACP methyl ester carboxylesterase